MMERRVEYADLRDAGAEQFLDGVNTFQVGRVVKGREFNTILYLPYHFFIEQNRTAEFFPAMNHAVSDGVNVLQRLYPRDIGFLGYNPFDDLVNGDFMVADCGG